MKISALIAENVRNFEDQHVIKLHEGLNVFIGKNNTGKSTLLRIPGLVERQFKNANTVLEGPEEMFRKENALGGFGFRWTEGVDRVAPSFVANLRNASIRLMAAERDAVHRIAQDQPWYTPTLDVLVRQDAHGRGCAFRLPGLTTTGPVDAITWFREYTPDRTPKSTPVNYAGMPEGSLLVRTLQGIFASSPFTSWAHRQIGIRDEYGQHKKRLLDANDDDVQTTLTFLKLKHENHFAALAKALSSALPEFGQLDFEEFGNEYKPAFKLSHTDKLLTRDLVGSGSWTFLSILTAAHAAVATGAETIVLDEPHLYLHPGLERRLVRELTSKETWGEKRPQLLVATHSPVFLDAAWREGKVYLLDWEDEKRTKVKEQELTEADTKRQIHKAVSVTSISELLYADRVVFVEGPSDVAALEVLTDRETHAGAGIRFQPLLLSDNAQDKDYITALYAVSRGFESGPTQRAGLYLDADKEGIVDKKWSSWGEHDPKKLFDVQWLGVKGHDMESLFADVDFLVAYFESRKVSDDELRAKTEAVVNGILKTPPPVAKPNKRSSPEKASQRLRALHDALLPAEEGGNKTHLLVSLATFYRSGEWTKPLPRVDAVIATLKGGPPTSIR